MTGNHGIPHRDLLFTVRLQDLSNQITRCTTVSSVLFVLAAVLFAVSSRYEPLLLMVPALLMFVVAELKMERLRQMTLDYLREMGIDVSDAPKPLFHSFRRFFGRS
jgi:hypothetical protein